MVSFLDTLFSSFVLDDGSQSRIWDPFGIQLGPKWCPKSAKWGQQTSIFHLMILPFAHPCFYETILITVPLGHGGF